MAAAPGPTTFEAAFVASDVVALGAIGALREAGRRVPDDVSIVGFDDIPLAGFFDPPLTTVRLPAFELGQAAGRSLIDRIDDRPVPERTLLPTELVIRSSTRRATEARNETDRDDPVIGGGRRRTKVSAPGGGRTTSSSSPGKE